MEGRRDEEKIGERLEVGDDMKGKMKRKWCSRRFGGKRWREFLERIKIWHERKVRGGGKLWRADMVRRKSRRDGDVTL